MPRGIAPWTTQGFDGKSVCRLRYRSDSGYGLCCARITDTHSCLALVNGEQLIGQATLDPHHVAAVRALFAGNTERPAEVIPFRERRALGEMAGFEVKLHADDAMNIRIYKNRFFPDQFLIALATGRTETCAVAFDDDEIASIIQVLEAL
jgi:hypothetical protein